MKWRELVEEALRVIYVPRLKLDIPQACRSGCRTEAHDEQGSTVAASKRRPESYQKSSKKFRLLSSFFKRRPLQRCVSMPQTDTF
jgi:hypothetical protein